MQSRQLEREFSWQPGEAIGLTGKGEPRGWRVWWRKGRTGARAPRTEEGACSSSVTDERYSL